MTDTHGTPGLHIPFDNTYNRLPGHFFARLSASSVAAPRLIVVNEPLAALLGIDPDALQGEEAAQVFTGGVVATGSEPLAQAYAGHQFGHFVPQLGDGRTNLLGEVVGRDGLRYDIQLKGSGPTPFSRRGDGRAALGPVLREYIVSEAMAAMGVPSTRALAAALTGQAVMRETVQPGAVFTRVASSHLRVGTFQYFWTRGDVDGTRTLADYAIQRHYPEAETAAKKYRALLDGVIGRQARLVAHWVSIGFVHGVMNTDNTSISGETIDYGPCAFLEGYNPDQVFSSIDQRGRYAYNNQVNAMHWNLARLAETLLPLLRQEEESDEAALQSAYDALAAFAPQFEAARNGRFCAKLGLASALPEDMELMEDLLTLMAENGADFTLTFRTLCDSAETTLADNAVRTLFRDPSAFDGWAERWRKRLAQEQGGDVADAMRRVNPVYIPRNHFIQEVIDAAIQQGDFQPFFDLLAAVTNPFAERPEWERYTVPALPHQAISQTFCGT